jgi:hypothetical protein
MTISALFTTPGIGGIIATAVLLSAAIVYSGLTYWILQGGREERPPWERMGWPYKSRVNAGEYQKTREAKKWIT